MGCRAAVARGCDLTRFAMPSPAQELAAEADVEAGGLGDARDLLVGEGADDDARAAEDERARGIFVPIVTTDPPPSAGILDP